MYYLLCFTLSTTVTGMYLPTTGYYLLDTLDILPTRGECSKLHFFTFIKPSFILLPQKLFPSTTALTTMPSTKTQSNRLTPMRSPVPMPCGRLGGGGGGRKNSTPQPATAQTMTTKSKSSSEKETPTVVLTALTKNTSNISPYYASSTNCGEHSVTNDNNNAAVAVAGVE